MTQTKTKVLGGDKMIYVYMYIAEEQSWQYNLHVTPYNKQSQMHTLHTEEECILIPLQGVAQVSDKGN